jgi:hypothetical protein
VKRPMRCRNNIDDVKTGDVKAPWISLPTDCKLGRRHPAYRRQELTVGAWMEGVNLSWQ